MISETTREKYEQRLNRLKELGIQIKPTQNVDTIVQSLEKTGISIGTIKNYLSAIQNEIRDNKDYLALSQEITEKIISIMQGETKKKDKNKLIGKEIENFVEWDKILKVFNTLKLEKNKNKTSFDKYLTLALYVLFPPRRIQDYSNMKIVKTNKEAKDDNTNYYINGKKGYFKFTKFKTKKSIGDQIYQVPKKLDTIIKEYISKYPDTEYLLNIGDRQLTGRLQNIFQQELNKNISVDILRKSYIQYLNSKKKRPTLANRKRIAQKMAHSVLTSLEYDKQT